MTVLFADPQDRRRLRIAEELHIITGLGRNPQPDGRLGEQGRARARAALRHFAARLDAMGVQGSAVLGAATAAVREASDGEDFLAEVAAETGLRLESIPGEQEAELVALAQERSFTGLLPLRIVDIGGGSTEVALRHRGQTAWKASLPVGSIKLAALHGSRLPELRSTVAEALRELPTDRERAALVGVAGTVTTGLQIDRSMAVWDPEAIHGQALRLDTVEALLTRLSALSPDERRSVVGLDPGRADFIVAGLCILEGVMRHFQSEVVQVSDRGVRFGLIYERWPRASLL